MANRLERSDYWFDPTAHEAIARVDRSPIKTSSKHDPYHATPEDVQRYSSVVFEPDNLISNGDLRRMHRRLAWQSGQ